MNVKIMTLVITAAALTGCGNNSNKGDTEQAATMTSDLSSKELAAVSASAWKNTNLGATTGSFKVNFDAVPKNSTADVVVGMSKNLASKYSDLATIIRFGVNGVLDVRDGSAYRADTVVQNRAGTVYRIRMEVDMSAKKYSVYVKSGTRAEVMLAKNYAFRSEQSAVTSLAYLAKFNDISDVTLSNMKLVAVVNPTPTPTPTPAPTPVPTPVPTPTPTPVPPVGSITHGSQITANHVGPAAIGITSFTKYTGTSIADGKSYAFAKEIAGTAVYDGFMVQGPHLLIQGADINGTLDISTSRKVVIRGSRVRSSSYYSIFVRSSANAGVYVLYADIGGLSASQPVGKGVNGSGDNFTMYRTNISWMEDGIMFGSSNYNLIENYMHDFAIGADYHNDGIANWGGESNVNILRNRIMLALGETGALNLFADSGNITNWLVDSNYLAGGGYTCYCGGRSAGVTNITKNFKFTNNIFGLDYYPRSGYWGAFAYLPDMSASTGNVFSGNKYSNGTALNP